MPDSTQQLVFKLIIDGKEAVATLDVVKGEFVVTGEAAKEMNDLVIKAYQGLISESLKYNTVSDANVKALGEYIIAQGLSVDQIQNSIHAIDQETNTLAINSEARKTGIAASANLKAALGGILQQQTGVNMGFQAGVPGVNSMRMAMTQFGYTLNDAQMFMVNARMGLMGISNNIPMIVQAFNDARAAATTLGTTLSVQLRSALMGGGGLIVGINAFILLMNVLPSLIDKTTDKVKELTESLGDEEKKVRTQQIEFNSLIKILDDTTSSEEARKGALKKLKEEYPEYVKFLETEKSSHEKIAAALKLGNEQFERKIKLAASERILQEYYDQAATAEYEIQKLGEKRKTAQKQFDEGNKARGFSLFAIDKDIAELETKKNEAIKKVQEFNVAMSQISSGLIDPKSGKPGKQPREPKDTSFDIARKELELSQSHAIKMAELEGKSDTEILELKQQHLLERIELYKLYAGDVTALNYALTETLLEIEVVGRKAIEKEDQERLKNALANRKERHAEDKKFEEDKAKFLESLGPITGEDEINAEETKTLALLDLYMTDVDNVEEKERLKSQIEAYYADQRLQKQLNAVAQVIGAVSSAYSQIYSIVSQEAKQEVGDWKTKEEQKLEAERSAALSHAQTQKQREKINEQFDKKKEALQKEADKKEQERLSGWFAFQKILAATQIAINGAQAIMKGYAEFGVVGGAIAQAVMAGIIAAQIAVVLSQKMPKGFAEGGRLPKGKAGIIEGTHNELIAPEEDFKSVFNTYSADLVKRALVDYKNYVTVSGGGGVELKNIERELTGLKSTINELNNVLKDGIDARAVYDDSAAQTLYLKGRGKYRRGKI